MFNDDWDSEEPTVRVAREIVSKFRTSPASRKGDFHGKRDSDISSELRSDNKVETREIKVLG